MTVWFLLIFHVIYKKKRILGEYVYGVT